MVTDKAEFVPLLEHNIELNQDVLSSSNVSALPLTWGSREEVSVTQSTRQQLFVFRLVRSGKFSEPQTTGVTGQSTFFSYRTASFTRWTQGLDAAQTRQNFFFRNQLKISLRPSSCYLQTQRRYFWLTRRETQKLNWKWWKCFLRKWKHISLGERSPTRSIIQTSKVLTFKYLNSHSCLEKKITNKQIYNYNKYWSLPLYERFSLLCWCQRNPEKYLWFFIRNKEFENWKQSRIPFPFLHLRFRAMNNKINVCIISFCI